MDDDYWLSFFDTILYYFILIISVSYCNIIDMLVFGGLNSIESWILF